MAAPWVYVVLFLIILIVLLVIYFFIIYPLFIKKGNKKVGEGCTRDKECSNSACARESADPSTPLTCCASGVTIYNPANLLYYCAGMPNGTSCWLDSMCKNGNCRGNTSGSSIGTCYGNGALGEACDSNGDCTNSACGRETAADDAKKVCCVSGKVNTFGGFDYCTGMPNESVCWTDAMCATGYCEGNEGGTKGICRGHLPIGATCDSNKQCSNQACGRETAADGAQKVCCTSGDFITFAGFDYCTGMPDGSVCWTDSMCETGYCQGNEGGTKGVCRGKLPVGATCDSNSQCNNKACGRETAAEHAIKVCCPSGDFSTYAGFDYCTQMPNGSVCWSDAMCASLYCAGNASGFQRGVCTTNKLTSQNCFSSSECNNGACGLQTAADGAPLICCPSGETSEWWGINYCTELPTGSICGRNSMCASNFCRDNGGFEYGTKKGICD